MANEKLSTKDIEDSKRVNKKILTVIGILAVVGFFIWGAGALGKHNAIKG